MWGAPASPRSLMTEPDAHDVVLAAVDRTTAGDEVIRTALALSRASPAGELHFVHVVDPKLVGQVPHAASDVMVAGEAFLEAMVAAAKELTPVRVDGHLRVGTRDVHPRDRARAGCGPPHRRHSRQATPRVVDRLRLAKSLATREVRGPARSGEGSDVRSGYRAGLPRMHECALCDRWRTALVRRARGRAYSRSLRLRRCAVIERHASCVARS